MKRSERHHLKENVVASSVFQMQDALRERRREIAVAIVAVVLMVGGAIGYLVWRQQTHASAAALLAEAMVVAEATVAPPAPQDPATATPPAPPPGSYPTEQAKLEAALQKFVGAAEAYPNTTPGIAARYHAAATLLQLGHASEAEQRYHEVVDRAGTSLYGQMARLGLAQAHLRAGKHDQAIELFKQASEQQNTDLPVDAILMQLGRAYLAAGKTAEAQQTFTRIVDDFPASLYAADARTELDKLELAAGA